MSEGGSSHSRNILAREIRVPEIRCCPKVLFVFNIVGEGKVPDLLA
jgi:hypothetical protein